MCKNGEKPFEGDAKSLKKSDCFAHCIVFVQVMLPLLKNEPSSCEALRYDSSRFFYESFLACLQEALRCFAIAHCKRLGKPLGYVTPNGVPAFRPPESSIFRHFSLVWIGEKSRNWLINISFSSRIVWIELRLRIWRVATPVGVQLPPPARCFQ